MNKYHHHQLSNNYNKHISIGNLTESKIAAVQQERRHTGKPEVVLWEGKNLRQPADTGPMRKTGTLKRRSDMDYIVVAGEQGRPGLRTIIEQRNHFDILLRDDEPPEAGPESAGRPGRRRGTCANRACSADILPANLAYHVVNLIHRHFLVPLLQGGSDRLHPAGERRSWKGGGWS